MFANKKDDYAGIIEECRTLIPEVMTKEKIPGLSIAIVDRNKTIWADGFGFSDMDHKKPITANTIFGIMSISKTITATAIMMAVQDGLVDLDQPIANYLPGFTINSRFEDNPETKITLKHLLSCTAGLGYEAPVGNGYDYPKLSSFEEHIQSISDTWLRYPVGQRFCYSTLGIDLAGYILQVKSGNTFNSYVKQKLLNPLRMTNSSFDIETIKRNHNRAVGHDFDYSHVPLEMPMIPSGGFYTSVSDLAKFVRFHLNEGRINGKSLLNKETLNIMYRIPFPIEGQFEGYALGISKNWSYYYNTNFYNHSGSGFGFNTNMVWNPEYQVSLIILTNNGNHNILGNLTIQIIDKIIMMKGGPRKYQQINVENKNKALNQVDLPSLKQFAGNYLGRNEQLSVTIDPDVSFRFNEGNPELVRFIALDECILGNYYYRFVSTHQTPAYIIRVSDGYNWIYNDGPSDQPGPDKKEWEKYLGEYELIKWGQKQLKLKIFRKNGYLYAGNYFQYKLHEYQPGLFFSSTGVSIEFKGDMCIFGSLEWDKIVK